MVNSFAGSHLFVHSLWKYGVTSRPRSQKRLPECYVGYPGENIRVPDKKSER